MTLHDSKVSTNALYADITNRNNNKHSDTDNGNNNNHNNQNNLT